MKFAVVDGTRREPLAKGEKALCPGCDAPVLAKAGEIVTWHWAHQAGKDCDSWHDPQNEGPWHRAWKALTIPEAQEITIKREGEHHRADVVGDRGTVIEFQHSPISPEMIQDREDFYGRMVWVFDGSAFLSRLSGVGTVMKRRLALTYRGMPLFQILDALSGSTYTPFPSDVLLSWAYPKKALGMARRPVYIDLGLGLPGHPRKPEACEEEEEEEDRLDFRPLALDAIEPASLMIRLRHYGGSNITVTPLSRELFIRRYMRTVVADPALALSADHEAAKRAIRVYAYRQAKSFLAEKEIERKRDEKARAARIERYRRELSEQPWEDLEEKYKPLKNSVRPEYSYRDPHDVPPGFLEPDWALVRYHRELVVDRRSQWLLEIKARAVMDYEWWSRQRSRINERKASRGFLSTKAYHVWVKIDDIENLAHKAHHDRIVQRERAEQLRRQEEMRKAILQRQEEERRARALEVERVERLRAEARKLAETLTLDELSQALPTSSDDILRRAFARRLLELRKQKAQKEEWAERTEGWRKQAVANVEFYKNDPEMTLQCQEIVQRRTREAADAKRDLEYFLSTFEFASRQVPETAVLMPMATPVGPTVNMMSRFFANASPRDEDSGS